MYWIFGLAGAVVLVLAMVRGMLGIAEACIHPDPVGIMSEDGHCISLIEDMDADWDNKKKQQARIEQVQATTRQSGLRGASVWFYE